MADKKTEARVLLASQEILSRTQEFANAKDNADRWTEIADALKEELKELAGYTSGDGSVNVMSGAHKIISIIESTRLNLDPEALARDYPDLDLNKYKTKPTIYATVKVHLKP